MITSERFSQITGLYSGKKIAVVGDFCLDRYFEIDPSRTETSIETGLSVHNIIRTRCQPGGAGTVLNNLLALGATSFAVSISGCDGEGWELKNALIKVGANLQAWTESDSTVYATPTYNKPLLMHPNRAPEELNRLDVKNYKPIPHSLEEQVVAQFTALADRLDFCIFMQQVDIPGTGVLTPYVLDTLAAICRQKNIPCIADSRIGSSHFPPMIYKMNRVELGKLTQQSTETLEQVRHQTEQLAAQTEQAVFVTLAEEGCCGALPREKAVLVPACLKPGPIDIVGAGDSVTANLSLALTCGATLSEAMELAMRAAAVVVHKLGTTGTASIDEIAQTLFCVE